MSAVDPQSNEARLARHRATHRVVRPDIAEAAREVSDLRLASAAKALEGAIELLTLMYESPSLAGTRALVLIEKELPILREALDDAAAATRKIDAHFAEINKREEGGRADLTAAA